MKNNFKYIICLISGLLFYDNVYAVDLDSLIIRCTSFIILIFCSIIASAVASYYIWKVRKIERAKKNVQERNYKNIDRYVNNSDANDREFLNYIDDLEKKTNILLAEFFDNIDNLEYVKKHCSENLYNNIVSFIEENSSKDRHIVVKDTFVHGNEFKAKKGNVFSTNVVIECFNYMEDSRGHYICGYKVEKEFVRKKITFVYDKEDIFIISIKNI